MHALTWILTLITFKHAVIGVCDAIRPTNWIPYLRTIASLRKKII